VNSEHITCDTPAAHHHSQIREQGYIKHHKYVLHLKYHLRLCTMQKCNKQAWSQDGKYIGADLRTPC